MHIKQQMLAMRPYMPGKTIEEVKEAYGLEHIVKLASNENPYGSSPRVQRYLEERAADYALYPDGNATSIRRALGAKLGVQPEQLLFGSGLDEVIAMISRTLLDSGLNAVMAAPTFPQYRHNAIIEGAEVREVPVSATGFHDFDGMLRAIDSNTSIVWVCNPNNPTGSASSLEEIEAFVRAVPADVVVALDEAYVEFVEEARDREALQLLASYPNLLVLRTFSKAYGLAGFRFGYAVGAASLIGYINLARGPFNTTVISQGVVEAALSDDAFIESVREKTALQKARFYAFAKERGLRYYPSGGNFVLMEAPGGSDEATEGLLRRGFIVRSGNLLGTPGFLRITVGTDAQNDRLFAALDDYLDERDGRSK